MESEYGISRSSIDMRLAPDPSAPVVHALQPQERLRILGASGDMLEVESARWQPPIRGFVPASGVVRTTGQQQAFPQVDLGGGISVPSVPISLPLLSFIVWLQTEAESPWLPPSYVEAMKRGDRPSVGTVLRGLIAANRSEWDSWVGEVVAEGRLDSATLDEWIVRHQGGRDMWSIRAERIFSDPSEHSVTLGWVAPEDILRWTGRVRQNDRERKYRTWYEVELTKAGKCILGWYKAALLDEYITPTEKTDLSVEENRHGVFETSRPRLRLPADSEIGESQRAGRAGAQFIDVRGALGQGLLHHNLCGEFCAAALGASDVIPLLQKWLAAYPRARDILAGDRGTSIPDLQSMLDLLGLKHEYYRSVGSTSPVTPTYVRRKLDAGLLAIVFTGVTPYGVVKSRSPIRHWVVVEDIVRVAGSGWLRVYNPFNNREETYRFDEVYDLPSRDSIGLWVEPARPAIMENSAAVAVAIPVTAASQLQPAVAD